MPIQAIFWDYDNTILETAEAHWNKHVKILASLGIHLDNKFRKRVYENNGNQNWEWMRKELGLQTTQKEYLEAVDSEFHKQMCALQLRPGVSELFDFFDNLGIPQAIITNARKDSAEPVLKQRKILEKMSFVLYKEDYEGRKPDPAPYAAGLKKMGALDPSKCIAIEDDPKGVESANRAGLTVVHRKLKEDESDCEFAHYTCYHPEDLVTILKKLTLHTPSQSKVFFRKIFL